MDLIAPIAVSTLGLIFLIVTGVLVLFFIGGLVAVYVRSQREAPVYAEHVREADEALEVARAGDRGWDRDVMEDIVRSALTAERPDFSYGALHLVLVEDRPGQDEDRAHFMAVGDRGEARVVLGRQGGEWVAESVG
jgi:cbb3-type cytochrome oxidase subunit 3